MMTAESTDRDALRTALAAALRKHSLCTNREEADADGNLPCRCGDWREPGSEVDDENDWEAHLADAALSVLPAPADRAAVLREAADFAESLRQFEPAFGARKSAQISENVGVLRVADELRRLADEAQQPKEALNDPDPDCERCDGSGLDPDAYFVDRDTQTWTHAPCSECLPEDDDDPEPVTGRVKHSGPDTKFCVLCLSGEHERVADPEKPTAPMKEQR